MQAQEALRASTQVAVSPNERQKILGFFTLVAIKIIDTEMPDDLVRLFKMRNLESGAPAVLLAQLGVDTSAEGQGLGTFLLKQALRHALNGALEVGGVALIIDALSPQVAEWYMRRIQELRPLTPDGLRLLVPMRTLMVAAATF